MSKRLFDTFRRILGRGLTQSEVDAINASMKPDAPTQAEQPFAPRKVSPAGIALLHRFEGCAKLRADGNVEAYPDPGSVDGNPWTIGWGSTGTDDFNGGKIKRGTIWSKGQCDERFEKDMAKYAFAVVRALGGAIENTSQPQFDALVSFHYNTGAIENATLTHKHIAGDHAGAANEFKRWVRNDGKVMKGLVNRRTAEEALYRSGM